MKITATGSKGIRLDAFFLRLSASITLQDIQELFSDATTLQLIVDDQVAASCKLNQGATPTTPPAKIPANEFRIAFPAITVPANSTFRINLDPNYKRLLNPDAVRIQVDYSTVEESQ
jgi:hypothetical protein